MTAYSKASKLKAKRGPKRKEGVLRTPSGQISRSTEAKALSEAAETYLAIEAATWRRRRDNPALSVEEARKQEHGSVIHRWHQAYLTMKRRQPESAHPNEFTSTHLDAALRFHQLSHAWSAVVASRRQRSSSDFSGSGGYDGRDPFDPTIAARQAKTERDYKEARKAILESGPLGMMAIETVVIENKEAPSLLPDLRLALNRLSVAYKWMDKAA